MTFLVSSKAFALPVTITIYPTQTTSLNYQIYYNGEKYMKDLEFIVTGMKARSSIYVKSSNSYLYVESIAFGDYQIYVEAEDFKRTYTVTLDEEYHENSHLTKMLDLNQKGGELGSIIVPDSEQLFPPNGGNKPDVGEDGDSEEPGIGDKPDVGEDGDINNKPDDDTSIPNEDGNNGVNSGNGNVVDSNNSDNSESSGDGSFNLGDMLDNIFNNDSLPLTGSKFRTENIALVLISLGLGLVLWKGVGSRGKKDS